MCREISARVCRPIPFVAVLLSALLAAGACGGDDTPDDEMTARDEAAGPAGAGAGAGEPADAGARDGSDAPDASDAGTSSGDEMDASIPDIDGGVQGMPEGGSAMPEGGAAGASGDADDPDGGQASGGDAGACVTASVDLSSALPKCSEEICPVQDSVCVPMNVLEQMMVPQASLDQLRDCDADSKCVPAEYVDTRNTFVPTTCSSINGNEGRCLSMCVRRVAERIDTLPRDVCDDNELCAPCFDPVTGEDTGACRQGCDPGPTEEPQPFATCCEGRGRCVSAELAGAQADALVQQGCADDLLCTPTELTMPGFLPAMCASVGGFEGRCLSTCVASVAAQIDQLPSEGCQQHERCAPCYDPITLESTGACEIGEDAPVDEPQGFAACCGGRGTCVTPELAGGQAESLAQDTCADDLLCAPTELTDPDFAPASCASVGGFEGRCLSRCLGAIADQADSLPSEGCAEAEVCAPCYDPFTGEDTGACTINDDAPAGEPETFAGCCDIDGTSRGVCVTAELAGEQAESLAQDTCADDLLCAPTELTDPDFAPVSCASAGGFEGRCLSRCLGAIADQADSLPSEGCAEAEVCAPCYDPITGEDTGACRINGDVPAGDPQTFAGCCDTAGTDRGVCVTPELAGEQADSLPQDTCATELLCAPVEKAQDSSFLFPSCEVGGIACFGLVLAGESCEGACVPACIVPEDQAGVLSQGACQDGELCAPCVDTDGTRTGSCD